MAHRLHCLSLHTCSTVYKHSRWKNAFEIHVPATTCCWKREPGTYYAMYSANRVQWAPLAVDDLCRQSFIYVICSRAAGLIVTPEMRVTSWPILRCVIDILETAGRRLFGAVDECLLLPLLHKRYWTRHNIPTFETRVKYVEAHGSVVFKALATSLKVASTIPDEVIFFFFFFFQFT
jgi:hypothetical protein